MAYIQASVKLPVGEIILTKSSFTNLVKVSVKSTLAWTAGYLWFGHANSQEQRLLAFSEGWFGSEYSFHGYISWLLFSINFRAKVYETGGTK